MRLVLLACLALLASACSPLVVLNLAVPSRGYAADEGIAYGALPRQKLDVYVPDPSAYPAPRPVIVFYYGGAWQGGERSQYKFIGEAFTSKGFVVVVPDYRVYPEVRYPGFVRDAAAAFAWTQRHVGRYGGNASHIVVMGHSAGAHIGAMLVYNERFLREAGVAPGAVHAFVGLAGPYDFRPDEAALVELLSGEGDTELAMPAHFVKPGAPPALLLQGDSDRRVSITNQEKMVARLQAAGDPVEARVLEGYGHPTILTRLARPLRDQALLDAIAAFAAR